MWFEKYVQDPKLFRIISDRCGDKSKEALSKVLASLGSAKSGIRDMLLELCVTELEDCATDTDHINKQPQPVTQESSHPYTGKIFIIIS